MNDFYGQPIKRLTTAWLSLEVLENAGPRIVRLSFLGSPNLFAELPNFVVPTSFGDYRFWGGHRLWHAPEAMPRTYFPDNGGLKLTEVPDGLCLEGPTEPHTGIQKSIEVHLAQDRAEVRLIHTLTNHGQLPVELAPWAITQLRLGGIVVAPMPVGNRDPEGLLPNRQISLWPYTRVLDGRLDWEDDFILMQARPALPACKIGYYNPHGWLAYWIEGVLFRKVFELHPDKPHPDGNCNAEIYCNDQFVELESLAPLVPIAPGGRVRAVETWEMFEGLKQPGMEAVAERLSKLGRI